ncbi:MAG: DegV family protein [Clostridiales bacterium]|jgi:DegV family protein with EDD domain|nr:DegV family protein [Clostridiales bacterium]
MTKIVVDSACDISDEVRGRLGLPLVSVPLTLQLGDTVYQDDETLDVDTYLYDMDRSRTVKTAAPSPGRFLAAFGGDESVFSVTVSSKLSGTFGSASLARQMYLDDVGRKFIHVFDSLSASVGETLIALKIGAFAREKLDEAEIVERVNGFISGLKTFFLLDKFDAIVKSGRMSPAVAVVASLLNIKPICAGVDGKMVMLDKARGHKKAVERLIEMIIEQKLDFENRILGISHCKCPEKAESIRDAIMARVPFCDAIILTSSGLCSTYANRGGVILAY